MLLSSSAACERTLSADPQSCEELSIQLVQKIRGVDEVSTCSVLKLRDLYVLAHVLYSLHGVVEIGVSTYKDCSVI